jgi:hypothetical protein
MAKKSRLDFLDHKNQKFLTKKKHERNTLWTFKTLFLTTKHNLIGTKT